MKLGASTSVRAIVVTGSRSSSCRAALPSRAHSRQARNARQSHCSAGMPTAKHAKHLTSRNATASGQRKSKSSCTQIILNKPPPRGHVAPTPSTKPQCSYKTSIVCIACSKCNTEASTETRHYMIAASLTFVCKRWIERFARRSHTAGGFWFSFSFSSSSASFSPSRSSLASASAVRGTPAVPAITHSPAAARGLSS